MKPFLFRRSNGTYYVSFQAGNRRRWKSTGTSDKRQALAALEEFDENKTPVKPHATLEEFSRDLLSYGQTIFSPKTLEIYRRAFEKFIALSGNKRLSSLNSFHADSFKMTRIREVSPASVNIDLRSLRAAFNMACRWKFINENPFKGTKLVRIPDRQPTYFTRDEFERFLKVLPYPWFRDFVITCLLTGARRSEVIHLQWDKIDFEARALTIETTDTFQTKAGKRRVIPMNETLHGLLRTRYEKKSNDLVFTFRGRKVEPGHVTKLFKKCVRKAEVNPMLHVHSLRHTFATWLVQEHVPIYEVQKLLGHSSVSVTQVYSHLVTSELHSAVEKISVPGI